MDIFRVAIRSEVLLVVKEVRWCTGRGYCDAMEYTVISILQVQGFENIDIATL